MYIVDIEFYLTQLEKTLFELGSGNVTIVTFRGKAVFELWPYLDNIDSGQLIAEHNILLGWQRSKSLRTISYNGKTIAWIKEVHRYSKSKGFFLILLDTLKYPNNTLDDIHRFHQNQPVLKT